MAEYMTELVVVIAGACISAFGVSLVMSSIWGLFRRG